MKLPENVRFPTVEIISFKFKVSNGTTLDPPPISMRNLPRGWMAPEVIRDGQFSTQSDVWAFAVTVWEIMTRAASPYPGIEDKEILSMLESGVRLQNPVGCPESINRIMQLCWNASMSNRPV